MKDELNSDIFTEKQLVSLIKPCALIFYVVLFCTKTLVQNTCNLLK